MDIYSPHISKMQVRNLFETYGDVQKVIMKENAALIQMPEQKRARVAIQNLDGMNWKGLSINLTSVDSASNTSNSEVN